MPPVSEAQRHLMYAAAGKKGGVAGVPQGVGAEFAAADRPGKLPAHAPKPKKKASERLYGKRKGVRGG